MQSVIEHTSVSSNFFLFSFASKYFVPVFNEFFFKGDGGITPRMVCAYALRKDACIGDSGGPVRRLSDGKLVGLVSFGPGNDCAVVGFPGVYTRLSMLRPWIYANSRV